MKNIGKLVSILAAGLISTSTLSGTAQSSAGKPVHDYSNATGLVDYTSFNDTEEYLEKRVSNKKLDAFQGASYRLALNALHDVSDGKPLTFKEKTALVILGLTSKNMEENTEKLYDQMMKTVKHNTLWEYIHSNEKNTDSETIKQKNMTELKNGSTRIVYDVITRDAPYFFEESKFNDLHLVYYAVLDEEWVLKEPVKRIRKKSFRN